MTASVVRERFAPAKDPKKRPCACVRIDSEEAGMLPAAARKCGGFDSEESAESYALPALLDEAKALSPFVDLCCSRSSSRNAAGAAPQQDAGSTCCGRVPGTNAAVPAVTSRRRASNLAGRRPNQSSTGGAAASEENPDSSATSREGVARTATTAPRSAFLGRRWRGWREQSRRPPKRHAEGQRSERSRVARGRSR